MDGEKKEGLSISFMLNQLTFIRKELVLQVTCLDLKAGEKKHKCNDEARRQNLNKQLGEQLTP